MTTTEDFTTLLDAFGQDVTAYDTEGGTSSAIRAIVDEGFPNQEEHSKQGLAFATATITVSADDWATPTKDNIFVFGGHTWRMDAEGWEKSSLNEDSDTVYKGHLERDAQ